MSAHQEVGILLGSLVEKILSESQTSKCLLATEDLRRASKVFKNILLKCRHWVRLSKPFRSIYFLTSPPPPRCSFLKDTFLFTRERWRDVVQASSSSVPPC